MPLEASQSRLALCVLVVEDDADTADTMAAILRHDGQGVQVARDGPAAIQACRDRWPDVVLLDLALPGCDGSQVAKRIREQSATRLKPLLIAVTGYGANANRLRSSVEGIDLHFLKPTDPEVLLRLLRQFAAG
jgi:CheY-like chemotaxis protein